MGPASLHGGQSVIIPGNGVVMLDALLGAALLVDLHEGQGRRVVLHEAHLRGHGHNTRNWGREARGGSAESQWPGSASLTFRDILAAQATEPAWAEGGSMCELKLEGQWSYSAY